MKVVTLQLTERVAQTLANMLSGTNVETGDASVVTDHLLVLLSKWGIEPDSKELEIDNE